MNESRKILILPAIHDHVGIIQQAKENGLFVITCDNMPQNPAHQYADKSYNINILDYDRLVEMAQSERIDFVWGYSTDIGALAAAKVSDALGLGANTFIAVDTMADKAKFRTFLREKGFNCPAFDSGKVLNDLVLSELNYPLVVKPVDRASSRGVSVIQDESELKEAFESAIEMSLCGEVIVEEYIDQYGWQLHGDAIVSHGEVTVFVVGDQYFNNQSPIGTVLPSCHNASIIEELQNEVRRFVKCIGFRNGGINVEARVNSQGELFIIELGPRSGGNYVPELLSAYLQMDVKDYLLSIMSNVDVHLPMYEPQDNVFQYIWRASESGQIAEIKIAEELDIIERYDLKTIGDMVSELPGADNIISIMIIQGKSRDQVEDVYLNDEKYFALKVV